MNNKKLIPIIIGILLALAIALGLIQRNSSPELDNNANSMSQEIKTALSPLKAIKEVPSPQKNATTFIAGGDISLSRNIAFSIDKARDPLLPFRSLETVLNSTDFNFANLETPFSKSDAYTPKDTLIFNAPKKNIEGLVHYNFKIVNLANNHAFDQGYSGLTTTKDWLTEHNIKSIGTGSDLDQAWLPEIVTSNGIKIGFIGASYSSVNDGGKTKNNYVARIEDVDRLKYSINSLKTHGADFVVVTMHAGTEYTRNPNQSQVSFAHTAIDLGADIVIGAHPHWVQTTEKYKDKYIFYSLGNFIFDQAWSQETKEGMLLKVSLVKEKETKLKQVELLPIIIENNSTPRLANELESKNIIKKIGLTDRILR